MKRSALNNFAALSCAALLAGCLFPRYTPLREIAPTEEAKDAMTVAEASAIVRDAIANPPAGHHPNHPGDAALGKYTTSIRLRKHNRTGLVLVEVRENQRISLEFYVRTQAEGEKFAAAVWRLKREYSNK